MGELPVYAEHGSEYIAHNASQYISRSVAALSAPRTVVARERIATILARARFSVQWRSYIATYLPDMEYTQAHRERMQERGKCVMPCKGEYAPALCGEPQAEEKQGREEKCVSFRQGKQLVIAEEQ